MYFNFVLKPKNITHDANCASRNANENVSKPAQVVSIKNNDELPDTKKAHNLMKGVFLCNNENEIVFNLLG